MDPELIESSHPAPIPPVAAVPRCFLIEWLPLDLQYYESTVIKREVTDGSYKISTFVLANTLIQVGIPHLMPLRESSFAARVSIQSVSSPTDSQSINHPNAHLNAHPNHGLTPTPIPTRRVTQLPPTPTLTPSHPTPHPDPIPASAHPASTAANDVCSCH